MALTISMTGNRQHRVMTMTALPGLCGLGVATLLQATIASPYQPGLNLLLPLLLVCAGLQILVGLSEWHRGQSALAVTFTAFGLFTCSQIPQLLAPAADSQAFFAAVSLQLFWGIFALLLAVAGDHFDQPFRLVLGAVGATLLGKAALLASGWTAAWPAILFAGAVVAGACGRVMCRIVASPRG